MKPLYISASLVLLIIFSGCRKQVEDRVEGRWKIRAAYYQGLFNRDYYQTGFEDGVFYFHENGTAEYYEGADTLSGYWDADFYDISSGDESQQYKYLRVELVDFSSNRVAFFDFDDYNFQQNFNCIRARNFRTGRDRIVEWVRP